MLSHQYVAIFMSAPERWPRFFIPDKCGCVHACIRPCMRPCVYVRAFVSSWFMCMVKREHNPDEIETYDPYSTNACMLLILK